MPFQFRDEGQGEQLRLAIKRRIEGENPARRRKRLAHHLGQDTALTAFRQMSGERLFGAHIGRRGVESDAPLIAMRLNRPRLIDDDRGHPRLAVDDEVLEKTAQVDAGAGHTEFAFAVTNQDVEPDARHIQHAVIIDVDVVRIVARQRTEEPGIGLVLPAQHATRLFAERLCIVVRVIAKAAGTSDRISVIAKITAIALGLLKKQGSFLRIVLIAQPANRQRGIGKTLGKRQFAGNRRENGLPLEQRVVHGVRFAKVVAHRIEYLPADQTGRQDRDQARQHQRHNRLGPQTESPVSHPSPAHRAIVEF